MSKKIFSGKNSQKFWDAVNKSKSNVLFDYGCKAQELESSNEKLLTACRQARNESHNPDVEKILKAVIVKEGGK